MEQKNPKRILKESLNNLSKERFKEFCHALVDPGRQETRIPRAKVEKKTRLEVADVMKSTFGEKRALEVAEKILREIKCTEAADELAKEAGAAGPGGPAGASSETGTANMEQKTPKKILNDSLNELSEENFNEFRDALLERKEKPRVPLVKVEEKSRLEVADVMITHFGEQRALEVAEKILREINCPLDADKLGRDKLGLIQNGGQDDMDLL